jgi:transposase-like protein
MSTGRRRCALCKYDFIPHLLPLRLTREEWKEIIRLFLMEQSSNSIVEQTGLDKKRVLRALLRIRTALAQEIPDVFSGTVEVDET